MFVLIVILAFIITHKTAEVNPHSQSIRKTTHIDSLIRIVYNGSNSLWFVSYELTQSKHTLNRQHSYRYSSHQCLIRVWTVNSTWETTQHQVISFIIAWKLHRLQSICSESHKSAVSYSSCSWGIRGSSWCLIGSCFVSLCVVMCPPCGLKTTNYPNLQRWQSVNSILKIIAIVSGLKYLGILRPLITLGMFLMAFIIIILV